MEFKERPIPFKEIVSSGQRKLLTKSVKEIYSKRKEDEYCLGETAERLGKRSHFNYMIANLNAPLYTITGKNDTLIFDNGFLLDIEIIKGGSFPSDYIFSTRPQYLIGMSVPPVMTAQVASNVYDQWLSKI